MSANREVGLAVLVTVNIRSKSPNRASVAAKIGVNSTAIDRNY